MVGLCGTSKMVREIIRHLIKGERSTRSKCQHGYGVSSDVPVAGKHVFQLEGATSLVLLRHLAGRRYRIVFMATSHLQQVQHGFT